MDQQSPAAARIGAVFLRDATGERQSLLEHAANSLPIYSVVYATRRGGDRWRRLRLARLPVDDAGTRDEFGPPNTAPTTGLAILDDHTLVIGTGERVKPTAGSFELWDFKRVDAGSLISWNPTACGRWLRVPIGGGSPGRPDIGRWRFGTYSSRNPSTFFSQKTALRLPLAPTAATSWSPSITGGESTTSTSGWSSSS